ncbi:uncharacterized protein LOC123659836 [Melitaea cinxia]|uniref:uncharacterized protein LOC123659836 n=1 Tax=Melitaea cinxia TaxID=113334 RepID=UPI001E270A93|nr:uncharacterized protein LOC123659836 [Melitaea cinxia]
MLLSKFTDYINCNLNDKKQVLALFIDFSRAFDTLDHQKLIKSLNNTGIQGYPLEWCSNYLKERYLSVKIQNWYSKDMKVTEGTAQGSVLGPVHFLAYVNDISRTLANCTTFQFADDTCLLVADSNINEPMEKLQIDFDALCRWCHDAGLVLNAQKTKLVHISSAHKRDILQKKIISRCHSCLHNQQLSMTYPNDCQPIEVVDNHTYLGLVIDRNLNWQPHINRICEKLRAFLANIVIIKNRISFYTRLLIYNAFITSVLSYGLSNYGRTYRTYLNSIRRLQIRIIKNIVPPKIKMDCANNDNLLFKICKTLPVHDLVNFNLLKEQFFNLDIQELKEHKIATRQVTNKKLNIPKIKNIYGKRTSAYLIPALVNDLDLELRNNLTPTNIKYILKMHFLNKL